MRKMLMLLSIVLLLVSCNRERAYIMTIEQISEEAISVNCSQEMNKGKKNVNSIGYLCKVLIDEQAIILDSTGNTITKEDLHIGQMIEVIPIDDIQISERNRTFKATKLQIK